MPHAPTALLDRVAYSELARTAVVPKKALSDLIGAGQNPAYAGFRLISVVPCGPFGTIIPERSDI